MAGDSLYLGLDLSTQQLKGIAVDANLQVRYSAEVTFSKDLAHYGTESGTIRNLTEQEIYAPVAMWLEAIDLLLHKLRVTGIDFARVHGISGAGMQHGVVFWSHAGEAMLRDLDGRLDEGLREQLCPDLEGGDEHGFGAFSYPFSPNWQDASTQSECDLFDSCLAGKHNLAEVTGSSAHHRFSGPQIMRFRRKHTTAYTHTARISLVSSYLASIFLGEIAPFDISDVCGMNLWDLQSGAWHDRLLELAAGGKSGVDALRDQLGPVAAGSGSTLGTISKYFVLKYGFFDGCQVLPFTGDNPATMLAIPIEPGDAIVSLGTSTTFLMATDVYKPDPNYHYFNHPTTDEWYMFMLCYKNGALAREIVRNSLVHPDEADSTSDESKDWEKFNQLALSSQALGQQKGNPAMRLALYFPLPEIVPNVKAGIWRFLYRPGARHTAEALQEIHRKPDLRGADGPGTARVLDSSMSNEQDQKQWPIPEADVRTILESQLLSLRLRSQPLLRSSQSEGNEVPPRPRRVYLVGGGSQNPAITRLCSEVLGPTDGVYRLDIGANACALGGAHRAAWACERESPQVSYESFLSARWEEERFVRKVEEGYQRGIWETYGEAMEGFAEMERRVLNAAGEGSPRKQEAAG